MVCVNHNLFYAVNILAAAYNNQNSNVWTGFTKHPNSVILHVNNYVVHVNNNTFLYF